MLKNYIKIALRNLRKNKIDSIISIGGMAVGLACCILLVFYVRFEFSHDNFHSKADRIYRITKQETSPRTGEISKNLTTSYPLSTTLASSYPEIESVVNIGGWEAQIRIHEKFRKQQVTLAGQDFFKVFDFKLLYGNPETALSGPDNIVITEKTANRIFGGTQAVGELLTMRFDSTEYTYTITGIAENPPANSSIQFDFLLPFDSYLRTESPDRADDTRQNWWIGYGETWILLNEKNDAKELKAKFPELLVSSYGKEMVDYLKKQLGLQNFSGAYFDQEYTSYLTGNTNPRYSMVLAGIALIILAIAAINFMSLMLYRSVQRSHEIGIRKATGAQSSQIRTQVFGEVFITSGIAFAIGLVLAETFSPVFQMITGRTYEVNVLTDPLLWFVLGMMLLVITLITGSYPSFVISTKKATQLFSSQRTTQRAPFFVKGLIAIQFTLATALIIGSLTISGQLSFLLDKDLGFSTSNVVAVQLDSESKDIDRIAGVLQQEIQTIPGTMSVALTGNTYQSDPRMISARYGFGMGLGMSGSTLPGFEDGITSEFIDEHYLETMGIELLAGQNFSSERPEDFADGILVTQGFADVMGWENPVGQIIKDEASWGPPFNGKRIIGVVEDVHTRPLYEKTSPLAFQYITASDYINPGTILVKTAPGKLSEVISGISILWNQVYKEETFKYSFLDDLIAAQYMEEQRWNRIIRFSSFMAIALACFGLFGLASLTAQNRTKEIGIRKVLGATVANIVTLLSKDFIKLILIGFVLASPLAWYVTNKWLAGFAYKINLGSGVFLATGALVLLVSLLTISWQSIRAANANPVESLRSE